MIIGFLVLIMAVVVGGVMWVKRPQPETPSIPAEGTPGGEGYVPPAEEMVELVVAAQDVIPRGTRITMDAVTLSDVPKDDAPEGYLTSVDAALGRIAREDITVDTPITDDMLTEPFPDLSTMSSDAALQIPEGMVAYALPVARYSSVAWAIQPGDHVDVLISVLVVELDSEFQSILPNQASCVEPSEEEGCTSGTVGRLDVLANGWVVNLTPSEPQRPRLVTQLTVQDVTVLHVGDWSASGQVPSDEETETPPPDEQGTVVTHKNVEPLTLIVTPQDAMVLKYAEEAGASIDLILRSAKDKEKGSTITTEAVTLQYIFDRFNIEQPPKLPYGVTPPARSLRHNSDSGRLGTGSEQLPEEVIMQPE